MRIEIESKISETNAILAKELCFTRDLHVANIRHDFEEFRDGSMKRFVMFDKIDWAAVCEAETAVLSFNTRVKAVSDNMEGNFKRWRQKTSNL